MKKTYSITINYHFQKCTCVNSKIYIYKYIYIQQHTLVQEIKTMFFLFPKNRFKIQECLQNLDENA